ncbi:MAG: DUF3800 domain-containing protein [Syntrophales bacterium LBB04]|nr:DUF3800 domain-containing protein [Syntrophales bacterium LBB04]
MHLLYLDDAGSAPNKEEEYFVLGGVSVFEAQANFITQELDKLAAEIEPSDPNSIEFHASVIYSRKVSPWNKMTRQEAQGVIKAVLNVFANSYDTCRAFACAVHKASYTHRDPVEMAFEDLCSRFDLFLQRIRAEGERHRGLIILDESSHETTLQDMARDFRVLGTRWGNIRHLADIPFFVQSKASRIVQLADHIAYAVFRRFNASDTQYFDIIASRFDSADGIIHGLCHKQNINPMCMCPACMSRRMGTQQPRLLV